MKTPVHKNGLVNAFQEAGLGQVRRLLLHSSLSSLGHVEGGADTVIAALIEALDPEATLVVPTFNYSLEDGVFDPVSIPSQTGAITEALRKWPQAIRSLHPTYSVAAIGKNARELTRGHWKVEPVGIDSPIDRLARAGGYVLLLGVKHDSNSSVHVGEAYAEVPYRHIPFNLDWPRRAFVRTESAELVQVDLDREPGCSTAFGVIEFPLRQKGCIRDFKVFQTKCQLMRAIDVIDATEELLRQRMDNLLCSNSKCSFCVRAREAIREWESRQRGMEGR
jgi:aminoglycoside 3-N-acetyltransferase